MGKPQLFQTLTTNKSMTSTPGETAIGIDLGTTYSCVGVWLNDKVEIITNDQGLNTTPSYVAFTEDERLIGDAAKNQTARNPLNTVFDAKRLIGRKFSDKTVQNDVKLWPFKVEAGGDDKPMIVVQYKGETKKFQAEQISSMVLTKMKEIAESFLGKSVKSAVITVPAYFNDAQRQATKDAGTIAGINVLRIINEPTAASLAYGFDTKKNETILVFDLGGGTFDVSVLEVGDGVFEVLSTSGDTHLGGDDFDKRITDFLADEFEAQEGINLLGDKQALQRLTEAAEKAKIELSGVNEAKISLPFITATADGPKHIESTLTRASFEELCSDLLDRCRIPVENSLRDAKLDLSEIDEIILVGGSTRIPAVQSLVKSLTGKDPNVTVNPDEVVALGAAVQAGVLGGEVSDIVLLDVTPLSLGLETLGGVMTKLIPTNTTLPTSKSEVFSTAADNQTSVEINVYQGEREFVRDNKLLGNFRLDGIPPAPRGIPQVDVKFDIDANGILSVEALDKGTNKKSDIKITGASTLSDDEVNRMVNDAEKFAETDKEKREAVDVRNQADSMVYQTEKQLTELADKVPADVKEKVEGKLNDLKASLQTEDIAAIKEAQEALQQEVVSLGQAIYSNTEGGAPGPEGADGQAPGPDPTGTESSKSDSKPDDDNVVDAEFKETDN